MLAQSTRSAQGSFRRCYSKSFLAALKLGGRNPEEQVRPRTLKRGQEPGWHPGPSIPHSSPLPPLPPALFFSEALAAPGSHVACLCPHVLIFLPHTSRGFVSSAALSRRKLNSIAGQMNGHMDVFATRSSSARCVRSPVAHFIVATRELTPIPVPSAVAQGVQRGFRFSQG